MERVTLRTERLSLRPFELTDVDDVYAIKNTRSWRVMEKLGMRRDGVLRSELQSDADPGSRKDMVVYSVLREEWQAPAAEQVVAYSHLHREALFPSSRHKIFCRGKPHTFYLLIDEPRTHRGRMV